VSACGTTVYITTAEQYEALVSLPSSLSGWFDPTAGRGEVHFATVAAARVARLFL